MDTSVPVEDPQKPKEIEFELDYAEPLYSFRLKRGTYARGAKLGSLFQTDRKRHVLCITSMGVNVRSFVFDYESICAIASERETTSRVPWDVWKHKTLVADPHVVFTTAAKFVGPRKLAISRKSHQGSFLRSFDFTPDTCRYTKQIDKSLDDAPRYAIRSAKLTDLFPEGHMVRWVFSEDNVLAFTVSRQVSLE